MKAIQHLGTFDNCRAGIEAHNSNLNVRNSSFINGVIMHNNPISPSGSAGGSGVYADATTELTAVDVTTGASPENNRFYENATSVESIEW